MTSFSSRLPGNHKITVVVVAAFTILGAILVGRSLAGTSFVAAESELGILTGNASLTDNDTGASGNGSVAFGKTAVSTVTINNGKLFVNGQRFIIRGVNYNPTATGSDQVDPGAAATDIAKIRALGANTVGTYMLGKSEYGAYSDITTGQTMYDALMPLAQQNGLRVIVGYYSNQSIDWTDSNRVAKVTAQYQALVDEARTNSATLMYMLGNEIFEKLSDNTQKTAYARWIGAMADWTHTNDPLHPVMYADSGGSPGLGFLKQYASSIDIYGVNDYSFNDASGLSSQAAGYASASGKPVLLHEWGADSYNVATGAVDETLQAAQITKLAAAADTVASDTTSSLVGGLQFEFSDEWRFVGSTGTQDPDAGWTCSSCGDGHANEDFWGLAHAAANGQAAGRTLKPAYSSLQNVWTGH